MTKQLKLIGLAGAAGCGKDTVAQIICTTQQFRSIALADPLRQGVSTMFGIPIENLIDRDLKEKPMAELCGKSPRQCMQSLGTEWGRQCVDPQIWLRVAECKIDQIRKLAITSYTYPIKGIVISDIRFPDEARWTREQGGSIWHISRTNNPNATRAVHTSEIPLIPEEGDAWIRNDGDMDQLLVHILNQINHPDLKDGVSRSEI